MDLIVDCQGADVLVRPTGWIECATEIGARGLMVTTGHGRHHADWVRGAGVTVCVGLGEAAAVLAGAGAALGP